MPHPMLSRRVVPTILLAMALATGCETGNGDSDNDRERASPSTSPTPPSRPARDDEVNDPNNTDNLRAVQADTRILSILNVKNEEEVRVGRLAVRRGESAAVKRYAEMLVRDHMNNNREVRSTADRLGINLLDASQVQEMLDREQGARGAYPGPDPSEQIPPIEDAKDPLAELEILEGAAFDRRFIELMNQGHEELIQMVEDAQRTVTREDVRSLLARTLPRLRQHAAEAQAISADPLRPPTLNNRGQDQPGGG